MKPRLLAVRGLVVALAVAALNLADAPAQANGCITSGAGTSSNPYLIGTEANLLCIANNAANYWAGKFFRQTADLPLTNLWTTPIGSASQSFTGTYDGGGHSITGLATSTSGTATYVGLFGAVSNAVIDDVHVTGTIYGATDVGGLVGRAASSTISNSTAAVNIVVGNGATDIQYVGGLVGLANGSMSIANSSASGTISKASGVTATRIEYIGGAVGRFMAGSMTNVEASGDVVGIRLVGGLIGQASEDSSTSILGSSASGDVTATDQAGGLIGSITQGTLSDVSASGSVTATGIYTGGLIGIAGSTSAVTLSDATATGNVSGTQGAGGLIGFLERGSVTRGEANGNVSGTSTVGGLIGGMRNDGTQTLTACSATGNVTGTADYIGGLIGDDWSDSISASFATGAVSGRIAVGGLIGRSHTGAMADVHATGNVTGTIWVGGLIGNTTPASAITISRAFATGNATGLDYVGGLIGWYGYTAGPPSYSTSLTDAFARGRVSATGTGGGSVIGNLESENPAPVRVYGTGRVSGSGQLGGLIGRVSSSSTLTASFWDTQTTERSLANGAGTLAGATGATTDTMTTLSTYQAAGWSIQAGWVASGTTWGMCSSFNDGYPYLMASYNSNPCVSNAGPPPPPWHQSYARATDEICLTGWNPSWAEWPNGRTGGFVCNRTFVYNMSTSTWEIRS